MSSATDGWRRRDDGAGTLEYVAMVLAAGILIGGMLLAVNQDTTDKLAKKVCEVVTSITGSGQCSESGEIVTKEAPEQACVLSTHEFNASAGVSVVVDVDVSGSVATVRMSDGTYRVIVGGDAAAGMGASAGANLDVGSGGKDFKTGAYADIGAQIKGAAALEFSFDSESEAKDFADRMENYVGAVAPGGGFDAAWQAANDVASEINSRLPDWSWIPGERGNGVEIPEVDAVSLEASTVAQMGIFAGGANGPTSGNVNGSVGAAQVLGGRVDKEGNITVYTRVEASLEAAAMLGITATDKSWGKDGSAQMEVGVAVTLDSDGNLSHVALTNTTTKEGSTELFNWIDRSTPNGKAPDGSDAGCKGGSGPCLNEGASVTAEFDVTDDNRDTAYSALGALGLNLSPGAQLAAEAVGFTPGKWILDEAERSGDLTVQALDADSNDLFHLNANVAILEAQGGLRTAKGTRDVESDGAWYWDGDDWQRWESCS